nr:GNAT family N-acetyltransferase [Angelakisella massiliensis]
MLIRDYKPEYCAAMASLFHETVHLAAARDYSPPQLDAWSPAPPDPALWNPGFLEHRTLVALMGETVVGFGDMTWEGYLDRLYVSAHHQGMGIASAICDRLEAPFQGQRITVHASITARPFFEKRGYRVLRQQQVARRGQLLTNFVMERPGSANSVQ